MLQGLVAYFVADQTHGSCNLQLVHHSDSCVGATPPASRMCTRFVVFSADRQATLWCNFGLERGQQHCGVAGCQ